MRVRFILNLYILDFRTGSADPQVQYHGRGNQAGQRHQLRASRRYLDQRYQQGPNFLAGHPSGKRVVNK